jgi:hypothetical protein
VRRKKANMIARETLSCRRKAKAIGSQELSDGKMRKLDDWRAIDIDNDN